MRILHSYGNILLAHTQDDLKQLLSHVEKLSMKDKEELAKDPNLWAIISQLGEYELNELQTMALQHDAQGHPSDSFTTLEK